MTLFGDDELSSTPRHLDEALSSPERRRIALGLSYDGTGFHGFAAQPGRRTVAGEVEAFLGRVAGHSVRLTCAGRTDAGVHARAQVVHADLAVSSLRKIARAEPDEMTELPPLARSITRALGGEIACWRGIVMPDAFDARRSATSRRYRYLVDTDPRIDPLRRHLAWHVAEPLDLDAIRIGTDALLGEHDFGAFCRRPDDAVGPLTRRILDAKWKSEGCGQLAFEIEANAFCHQMVRSVVGLLVAVGRGRARASDVADHLREARREAMPDPAPPGGLCLVAVGYPAQFGGRWQ